MKILFFLLLTVGLVWSMDPQPTREQATISIKPRWESEVEAIQVMFPVEQEAEERTITIAKPSDIEIKKAKQTIDDTLSKILTDTSDRLFYANNEDSDFGRITLNLTSLDLTGEQVKNILHELNETTRSHLARLDLSHNRIWDLPARVFPVELEYGLEELRLDYNWLQLNDDVNTRTTRFELSRLRSLKKLSLAHCRFTTLGSSLELPPLHCLNLSGNRLVELPSSLAALSSSLQELDASDNRLRYLGSDPLSSLVNLKVLNLSHSGLETVWDDPLKKLYSLETLHLDGNLLSEPPKLYRFTGSYQPRMTVYLSGNQFKCGCSFSNILADQRLQVADKLNVTCRDGSNVEWSPDTKEFSQCSPHWEVVKKRLSSAKDWFRDNRPTWETFYRSLGWVLFGLTLGMIYAHRRFKKTPPTTLNVPYNILQDGAIA